MADYRIIGNAPIRPQEGAGVPYMRGLGDANPSLFASAIEGLQQGANFGANLTAKILETQRLNDPQKIAADQLQRDLANQQTESAIKTANILNEIKATYGMEAAGAELQELKNKNILFDATGIRSAEADIAYKNALSSRSGKDDYLERIKVMTGVANALKEGSGNDKSTGVPFASADNSTLSAPNTPRQLTQQELQSAAMNKMLFEETQQLKEVSNRREALTARDSLQTNIAAEKLAASEYEKRINTKDTAEKLKERAALPIEDKNAEGILSMLAEGVETQKAIPDPKDKQVYSKYIGDIIHAAGGSDKLMEMIAAEPDPETRDAYKLVADSAVIASGDQLLRSKEQETVLDALKLPRFASDLKGTYADVGTAVTKGTMAIDDDELKTVLRNSRFYQAANAVSTSRDGKPQPFTTSYPPPQAAPIEGADLAQQGQPQGQVQFLGKDGSSVSVALPGPAEEHAMLNLMERVGTQQAPALASQASVESQIGANASPQEEVKKPEEPRFNTPDGEPTFKKIKGNSWRQGLKVEADLLNKTIPDSKEAYKGSLDTSELYLKVAEVVVKAQQETGVKIEEDKKALRKLDALISFAEQNDLFKYFGQSATPEIALANIAKYAGINKDQYDEFKNYMSAASYGEVLVESKDRVSSANTATEMGMIQQGTLPPDASYGYARYYRDIKRGDIKIDEQINKLRVLGMKPEENPIIIEEVIQDYSNSLASKPYVTVFNEDRTFRLVPSKQFQTAEQWVGHVPLKPGQLPKEQLQEYEDRRDNGENISSILMPDNANITSTSPASQGAAPQASGTVVEDPSLSNSSSSSSSSSSGGGGGMIQPSSSSSSASSGGPPPSPQQVKKNSNALVEELAGSAAKTQIPEYERLSTWAKDLISKDPVVAAQYKQLVKEMQTRVRTSDKFDKNLNAFANQMMSNTTRGLSDLFGITVEGDILKKGENLPSYAVNALDYMAHKYLFSKSSENINSLVPDRLDQLINNANPQQLALWREAREQARTEWADTHKMGAFTVKALGDTLKLMAGGKLVEGAVGAIRGGLAASEGVTATGLRILNLGKDAATQAKNAEEAFKLGKTTMGLKSVMDGMVLTAGQDTETFKEYVTHLAVNGSLSLALQAGLPVAMNLGKSSWDWLTKLTGKFVDIEKEFGKTLADGGTMGEQLQLAVQQSQKTGSNPLRELNPEAIDTVKDFAKAAAARPAINLTEGARKEAITQEWGTVVEDAGLNKPSPSSSELQADFEKTVIPAVGTQMLEREAEAAAETTKLQSAEDARAAAAQEIENANFKNRVADETMVGEGIKATAKETIASKTEGAVMQEAQKAVDTLRAAAQLPPKSLQDIIKREGVSPIEGEALPGETTLTGAKDNLLKVSNYLNKAVSGQESILREFWDKNTNLDKKLVKRLQEALIDVNAVEGSRIIQNVIRKSSSRYDADGKIIYDQAAGLQGNVLDNTGETLDRVRMEINELFSQGSDPTTQKLYKDLMEVTKNKINAALVKSGNPKGTYTAILEGYVGLKKAIEKTVVPQAGVEASKDTKSQRGLLGEVNRRLQNPKPNLRQYFLDKEPLLKEQFGDTHAAKMIEQAEAYDKAHDSLVALAKMTPEQIKAVKIKAVQPRALDRDLQIVRGLMNDGSRADISYAKAVIEAGKNSDITKAVVNVLGPESQHYLRQGAMAVIKENLQESARLGASVTSDTLNLKKLLGMDERQLENALEMLEPNQAKAIRNFLDVTFKLNEQANIFNANVRPGYESEYLTRGVPRHIATSGAIGFLDLLTSNLLKRGRIAVISEAAAKLTNPDSAAVSKFLLEVAEGMETIKEGGKVLTGPKRISKESIENAKTIALSLMSGMWNQLSEREKALNYKYAKQAIDWQP